MMKGRMMFKIDVGEGNVMYAFSDVSNGVFVIESSVSRVKMKVAIANPEIDIDDGCDGFLDLNDGRDLRNDDMICSRGKMFKAFVKDVLPPNELGVMSRDEICSRSAFIVAVACGIDSSFESGGLLSLAMSVSNDRSITKVVSEAIVCSPMFKHWRSLHTVRLRSAANAIDVELHKKRIADASLFPDWTWK